MAPSAFHLEMLRLHSKDVSFNGAQEGRTLHTSCCFSKSAEKEAILWGGGGGVGPTPPFNGERKA